jgi:hypothetical protein
MRRHPARFSDSFPPRERTKHASAQRLGEPEAIGEIPFVFVDVLKKGLHEGWQVADSG